jgi:hypothetical protein
VRFRVVDLQGKSVWSHAISRGLTPGAASFVWNGRDQASRRLAGGVYILRMSVVDARGALSKVGEQRLTYLP